MKNQNVLSTLKLRASYGVTGTGRYRQLQLSSGIYTEPGWRTQAIMGDEYIYTYRPEIVCIRPEMGNYNFMELWFRFRP